MNIFSLAGKDYRHPALSLLRLAVGFAFMAHGWAKLNRGVVGFEKLLNVLHVPLAHINSYLVPIIELLGGLAVLIGAFTAIAAIPLLLTMLVAMLTIHLKLGYSAVKTIGLTADGPVFGPPGYEINLIYITALIVLAFVGPGTLSIDGLFYSKQRI